MTRPLYIHIMSDVDMKSLQAEKGNGEWDRSVVKIPRSLAIEGKASNLSARQVRGLIETTERQICELEQDLLAEMEERSRRDQLLQKSGDGKEMALDNKTDKENDDANAGRATESKSTTEKATSTSSTSASTTSSSCPHKANELPQKGSRGDESSGPKNDKDKKNEAYDSWKPPVHCVPICGDVRQVSF